MFHVSFLLERLIQEGENNTKMTKISFVLSVYNEIESLPELVKRVNNAIESLDVDYELIFVDDGSKDGSTQWIFELSRQNEYVILVEFSRNFGHEAAMKAGIDICSGDVAIIMDTDLQHPPELVPEMFRLWKDGNKVVHAVWVDNLDSDFLHKFASRLFYKLFNIFSPYDIPTNATDFKLIDKDVIYYLKQMKEKYIFLRGLVAYTGFKQTTVTFQSPKRKYGRSSYSTWKLTKLALSSLLSFSLIPLKIVQYLGLMTCFLSCIYGIIAVLRRIFFDTPFGFTSILASALFLGSIQLISLGVIAEYVGRIYVEIKDRPSYIVHRKKTDEVNK